MHSSFNRRNFLLAGTGAVVLSSGLCFSSAAQAMNAETQADEQQPDAKNLQWHRPEDTGVEGRGFDDTRKFYDRLPARAEGKVRDAVWDLSRHSSGISFRFKTDSPAIHVRYRLSSSSLAMPHMPATGVSGVDLYAKDDEGVWRWVAVVKPTAQEIDTAVVKNLIPAAAGPREFMMYLPLYNGVEDLEIGVAADATCEPDAPRTEKPIVFYGTSIMHGACASRSGMSISAILGRRFDRPTINLGFSGNGRMETEVGEFLCEIEPCVFAIDCLPNMNADNVTERCEPLVRQIRAARPETPILLVEDRTNAGAWIRSGQISNHNASRAALKRAFDNLTTAGIQGLYYLGGDELLGGDNDGATDGSHPNDLGMMRYADAYQKILQQII